MPCSPPRCSREPGSGSAGWPQRSTRAATRSVSAVWVTVLTVAGGALALATLAIIVANG